MDQTENSFTNEIRCDECQVCALCSFLCAVAMCRDDVYSCPHALLLLRATVMSCASPLRGRAARHASARVLLLALGTLDLEKSSVVSAGGGLLIARALVEHDSAGENTGAVYRRQMQMQSACSAPGGEAESTTCQPRPRQSALARTSISCSTRFIGVRS